MPSVTRPWVQCREAGWVGLKSWDTKWEQVFDSKPSGFLLPHTLARVSWEKKKTFKISERSLNCFDNLLTRVKQQRNLFCLVLFCFCDEFVSQSCFFFKSVNQNKYKKVLKKALQVDKWRYGKLNLKHLFSVNRENKGSDWQKRCSWDWKITEHPFKMLI